MMSKITDSKDAAVNPAADWQAYVEDFRRAGHQAVDWIAQYLSSVAEKPVLAQTRPGELLDSLPPSAPDQGEPFAAILRDFDRRVRELSGREVVPYVAELKLDGLSMALTYENAALVRGVTRGDGTTGEDVTANVRTIRSVPIRLDKKRLGTLGKAQSFEVRGEVVMTLKSFQEANAQREAAGEPRFANPRNSAAGTMRQLDARIVASRKLDMFVYFLLVNGRPALDEHWKSLEAL